MHLKLTVSEVLVTFVLANCRLGGMYTEQYSGCNGQAADCNTMVEKLRGKLSCLADKCSWNSVIVSELKRMSTTMRCSRAVYS